MQWTAQGPSDYDFVVFGKVIDPFDLHRVQVTFEAADGITAVNSLWNSGAPDLDISFLVEKALGQAYTYEIDIYNKGGNLACRPLLTK